MDCSLAGSPVHGISQARIDVEHSCNKEALRLSLSPRLIRQEGKGKEKGDKEKGKLYEQDRQREER